MPTLKKKVGTCQINKLIFHLKILLGEVGSKLKPTHADGKNSKREN